MNNPVVSRGQGDAGRSSAASPQRADNEEMLDYECGRKCRICPFPGAQCTATGMGNRD